MKNNEVKLERRLVLEVLKTENKRGFVQIAIIDWVGEKSYRMLEKREFYSSEGGLVLTGKAKGFNRADWALLLGQHKTITDLLMQTPPAAPKAPQNEFPSVSDEPPARDPWDDA